MTSATEPRPPRRLPSPDPRFAGAFLCATGLGFLAGGELVLSALGLELIAAAFWWWARASEDAAQQVPRWNWLRRPATALWLAAAIHAAVPALDPAHAGGGAVVFWRILTATAIVWAGLELLAALPFARPFSDLPGPLIVSRPWLPVLLPSAGFVVLWRHQAYWMDVTGVRETAAALLLLTAALAALRAFARRGLVGSLRWLVVCDGALAGLLVAVGGVTAPVSILLWMGACGGHAFLIAAELRGATPRRGFVLSALWRLTTWIATTALTWPILLALYGATGRWRVAAFVAGAIAVLLASWVTVGRIEEAPERRAMMRRDTGVTLSHLLPLLLIAGGPATLLAALWAGSATGRLAGIVALVPAVIGGALGIVGLPRRQLTALGERVAAPRRAAMTRMRATARGAFRSVIGFERRLVASLRAVGLALLTPLRDLHSADAQEYLLFLVGVSILAMVLPLLR